MSKRTFCCLFVLSLVLSCACAAFALGTGEAPSAGKGPKVGQVWFDNKAYFPGDIISSQPKVTAMITDDAADVRSIEVWTDTALLFSGGPGTSFDPLTGVLDFTVADEQRLSPGTYEVFIKATDAFRNMTIEALPYLNVAASTISLSGPYFYQISFKPSEGDHLTVSYDLSASGPIKLLIYNGAGDLVWQEDVLGGEGLNTVTWSGRDRFGKVFPNGYYSLKIVSGNRALGGGKFMIAD